VTPEELTHELTQGQIRPAYLLAGPEPLLRDDALAALRERVLADGASDFNLDRVSGAATAPAQLEDLLRTLPVMAERRLVVLSEPEPKRGAGRELAGALPDLLQQLAQQQTTVLVICADKVDRRSRWVKAFADPLAVVACEAPRRHRELVAFVRGEAVRQGVEFAPAAADALVERIGAQLLLLRNEIAKAALLAGQGLRVERSHIEAGASLLAEEPIWDLTDAIGQGRQADALTLLDRMLRGGAPAPVILGSLASHFRKLTRLRSGGRVPGPPFVTKKLGSQAQRYSQPQLLGCIRAIHEADTALKGAGSTAPDLTLERLVLNLSL